MEAPAKRPRKFNGPQSSQRKPSALNPLKKKIRDLTRLLAKVDGLPADVRMESERALAAYQQELKEAQLNQKEQKLSKKYHMVKFVERQKATRRLRKAEATLSEAREQSLNGPELEKIEKEREDAEVDLNYTMYYPRDEKYVSLFAVRDEADMTRTSERPAIWYKIQEQTRDGTLGKALQSAEKRSKVSSQDAPKPTSKAKSKLSKDSKHKKGQEPEQVVDSDSSDGGGFFEE